MNLKDLLKKLNIDGSKKNYTNILILALVGMLLVISSSFFKSSTPTVAKTNTNVQNNSAVPTEDLNTDEYANTLKIELKNVLQQIKGIGRVADIVYCEGGEDEVPAFNNNETTSNTTEKATDGSYRTITEKTEGSTIVLETKGGDSDALILKKDNPKVTGVFIVCDGGDNEFIQLEVTKAVSSLYDISKNQVNVYPMKK